jgi:hypothetical protein
VIGPDFERVLEQGRAVRQRFPALDLVAVGGTAAALHCQHRFSLDVDSVTPRLREQFAELSDALPHALDQGFFLEKGP